MDIAARPGFLDLMTNPALRAKTPCVPVAPARVVMKLDPYRIATLETKGPAEIGCMEGQVWITLPGQTEDVILHAGQRHLLPRATRGVVISTVGTRCPATFGIRATVTKPWSGRAEMPFQLEFA
ncbi:DUF2917 domain-containing protein [Noviherbaspirillum denitrificans]|uniref:DUF2917 domain-containing protein n=1 Tax=Noviherbaspirillum denitrificans TaxID=1968433 RepID=A0A254TG68_9BURK|nr:DUF2917 domain-containing protein [Noviherbaspirillum denitrificans]OWW21649.1 hypothetical protein AYR66_21335 [Noviherbaspirillum denitrificans]